MLFEKSQDFDVNNGIFIYKYNKYKKILSLLDDLKKEEEKLKKELQHLNFQLKISDLKEEDWKYILIKSEIDTLIYKMNKNRAKQELCEIKLRTLNEYS